MVAPCEGVLLGGHSHLNALVGDRYAEEPALRTCEAIDRFDVLDGPWPRSEPYWRRLAETSRGRRVGLIWGGNEHNSIYFFRNAYNFDFASKYVSRVLDRVQILTQRTVKKRFRDLSLNHLDAVLASLVDSGPERLALVGTPPPKKDSEKLRAMLDREPVFLAWAAQINADRDSVEITDPYVRLKLWYLLQEMFREAADRHGAQFIGVPPESQDQDGFLKDEFWAPDVTHANAEYGRIMLAKVLEELRA